MRRTMTILLAVGTASVSLTMFRMFAYAQDGGGEEFTVSPAAGMPRAWEAGLSVSPYSVINLYNGNLITILPLIAFDPVGPPVEFVLYHNSAAAADGDVEAPPTGFSLGAGWTTTYGSGVTDNLDGTVTLTEDDGNQYVYTLNAGTYDPPAGKHDRLVWDADNSQWVVTRTRQTQRIFDSAGRLIEVFDSAGNKLAIERDSAEDYRITEVRSAAQTGGSVGSHKLTFTYDGNDRLASVVDPLTPARTWTFDYDLIGRLWKVHHPYDTGNEPITEVGYDNDNLIVAVISRDSQQWDYTYYTDFKLATVTDPLPGQTGIRAVQQFAYIQLRTDVTDRRGYVWRYTFDGLGRLRIRTDPLVKTRRWTYDSDNNRLTFKDELNHTWTATYGAVAKLETLTSPLSGTAQTWTTTWVQPDPTDRPNFWRITQVSDPLGQWVQYAYADANDPTLVTTVTEQEAALGTGTAVTTLEYYDATVNHARGQLKQVITDKNGPVGNGVKHLYEFDQWGYFEKLTEGLFGAPGPNQYPTVIGLMTKDAAGRTTGGTNDTGVNSGTTNNPDGNPTGVTCSVEPEGPTLPLRLSNELPAELPHLGTFTQCLLDATYDIAARPTMLEMCLPESGTRTYTIDYDNLGRVTQSTLATDEHQGSGANLVTRDFDYVAYDLDGRLLQRTGPDSQDTWYLYDDLGRPKNIYRNGVNIAYTYDDAGRLTLITNANGTKTVRAYDDANRLTQIRHEGPSAQLLTQIDYNWRLDNTIDTRTETDATVQPQSVATVTFEYDDRQRLTREKRVVDSQTVYDIAYTYDQLGNRLTKVDTTSELVTTYFYDTVAGNRELLFQTNNNRLLRYEEKLNSVLQRTVSYVYYKTGDVSNITIKDEGTGADFDWYRDLAFTYYSNGSLGVVLWDRWKEDGQGTPTDYERLSAKEFRNHSPRARFMVRDVDPAVLPTLVPVGTQSWTDYDGLQPYNDFDVTLDGSGNPVTADTLRYTAGFGPHAQQTVAGGATEYLHGDLIRSTTLTTDDVGAAGSTFAYTAFGEPVGADPSTVTRYGYAGGWGYESGLLTLGGATGTTSIALQHLGARWYQPDIGRFVQRDPIGIKDGLNVYAYSHNIPTVRIDPSGLGLIIGPPPATGSSEDALFDWFWTKVHYGAGYGAGKIGLGFWQTICIAYRYEVWEVDNWPGFRESELNQLGDIIAAGIGWIDSHGGIPWLW